MIDYHIIDSFALLLPIVRYLNELDIALWRALNEVFKLVWLIHSWLLMDHVAVSATNSICRLDCAVSSPLNRHRHHVACTVADCCCCCCSSRPIPVFSSASHYLCSEQMMMCPPPRRVVAAADGGQLQLRRQLLCIGRQVGCCVCRGCCSWRWRGRCVNDVDSTSQWPGNGRFLSGILDVWFVRRHCDKPFHFAA